MDTLKQEQRHKCMLHNTSKDTVPEILLRKALWHAGIRYRKNYKKLPGTPDVAITKYKIAVFCDGEFWHGATDLSRSSKYWQEKIKRNCERDLENTIALRDMGWLVIRFWEREIRKHLGVCVEKVRQHIELRKQQKRFRGSLHD